MAVTEMLLGERALHGLQGGITYDPQAGLIGGNINGAIDREPIGELRERFSKLKARDALLGAVLNRIAQGLGLDHVGSFENLEAEALSQHAKLKARDNLLGAILARLGADPGARETAAHAAVGRVLDAQSALDPIAKLARLDVSEPRKIAEWVLSEKKASDEWTDKLTGALTQIAQGLGLSATKPDELAAQVLAMNAELTSALARAQERIRELEGQADDNAAAARQDVALLRDENAKLKAELEASATREKRTDAALRSRMDDTRAAEAYIASLKAKLAETDLDRVLAEARVSGLAAELQALERTMRKKLRP